MRQIHRILAALALGAIVSSGVLLTSMGLALAAEPEVEIKFPIDGGTFNQEDWDAGCGSVGFCGKATGGVTGSGVQISIRQLGTDKYWHADITSFATGTAVFDIADGFEDWSYAFPFGNFPESGDYMVHAQPTDDATNVEDGPSVTFTIATTPPKDGIKEGKPRGFTGVVAGEQGTEPPNPFTLIRQGTGEREVEIHLPADGLKFKTPGGPRKGVFEGGARIVVLARWTGEMWLAEMGLVKPAKPSFTPSVGVVVSQENGTLTLSLPNGEETTVTISAGDSAPEVGEVVTVFKAQPVDENDGSPVKATGLVRASEVRQRLEGFLANLEASEGELTEKAKKARSKRVANIASALEAHSAKHDDILQSLVEREGLPPQARIAIERALENSILGRGKPLKIAARDRDKAGPPEGRGKPDSAGPSNTERGSTASAGQGDKGEGKPDSTEQDKAGRGSTASADQGNKGKGKPDSAGPADIGKAEPASAGKGEKGQAKANAPGAASSGNRPSGRRP